MWLKIRVLGKSDIHLADLDDDLLSLGTLIDHIVLRIRVFCASWAHARLPFLA